MIVGERIKEARTLKGLSLQDVAGMVGVSKMSVHRWESGVGYPTVANLKKLEKVLDLGVISKKFLEVKETLSK
jgi:transcriptional regulator with XRE-family HTH domain